MSAKLFWTSSRSKGPPLALACLFSLGSADSNRALGMLLTSLTRRGCLKNTVRLNWAALPCISARLQSTSAEPTTAPKNLTKEEARGKAQAILEMLPGDSMFKKSAYATLGAGLASFLVAKGIYIPNEETLILVAFLIMTRLAYVKLATPIGSLFETYINDLKSKMTSASKSELKQLESEIVLLEAFRDSPAVVQAFFETRRENILLEADLFQVQQRHAFLSSVKAKLDEQVRRETERAAQEKRMRAEALIKGLLEELKKPKVQDAIMKKCIADLGKVPTMQAML